jgi:hypothetical protein
MRPVAFAAGAIAVAGVVWWFGPLLLEFAGLGAFGLVGRLCLVVLALSATETVLHRIPASGDTRQ